MVGCRRTALVLMLLVAVLAFESTGLADAAGHVPVKGAVRLARADRHVALGGLCVKPGSAWLPGAHVAGAYYATDHQLARDYRSLATLASTRSARRRDLARSRRYGRASRSDAPVCRYLGGPAGAVKLAAADIRTLASADCARIAGAWVPAVILSATDDRAISDATIALDYYRVERVARGVTKTTASADHLRYLRELRQEQPTCSALGATSAAVPLRFNFRGAAGLALITGASAASAGHSKGHSVSGSVLDDVSVTGQLSSAISSGVVSVENYYIAPDNHVFLQFAEPVDLSDPSSTVATGASDCVLAEVDQATGVPTCIDQSSTGGGGIFWNSDGLSFGPSAGMLAGAPVQLDASGDVYYAGATGQLPAWLDRYAGGATTTVHTASTGEWDGPWLVLPNGSVLLTGWVSSITGQINYTQLIAPDGSVTNINTLQASYMVPFPDGSIYVGYGNDMTAENDVYVPASGALEPWGGACVGSTVVNSSGLPCGAINPAPSWMYTTPSGDVFQVAGNALQQIYPTIATTSTGLASISYVHGVGDDILMGGADAGGNAELVLFDTTTDKVTPLLNASPSQLAISAVAYDATNNSAIFGALQLSDDQDVIGTISLSTGQVTIQNANAQALSNLQTFH